MIDYPTGYLDRLASHYQVKHHTQFPNPYPLQELISSLKPDYIAGIESRGFISASALAFKLEVGFVPIRKPNKLPDKVIGVNYKLEYGEDRLEIQQNSIEKDSKIIVIDDLLATGGTAGAAGKLIREAGGNLIGYAFLVELTELNGRNKLESNVFVESIIKYQLSFNHKSIIFS